jgi:hypothetical protein
MPSCRLPSSPTSRARPAQGLRGAPQANLPTHTHTRRHPTPRTQEVRAEPVAKDATVFRVCAPQRVFEFRATSAEDAHGWIRAINGAAEAAQQARPQARAAGTVARRSSDDTMLFEPSSPEGSRAMPTWEQAEQAEQAEAERHGGGRTDASGDQAGGGQESRRGGGRRYIRRIFGGTANVAQPALQRPQLQKSLSWVDIMAPGGVAGGWGSAAGSLRSEGSGVGGSSRKQELEEFEPDSVPVVCDPSGERSPRVTSDL